jgi:hypothetical protein
MSQGHARIFESLRHDVLARLVEVRGSIDHAYTRIPEDRIREQFDTVLDKMASYLATEDPKLYRTFASRYMAMRVGEGVSAENLIHSVVAIGDVVIKIAESKMPRSHERNEFTRAVVRMNFVAARMLVILLGEEVKRREQQLRSAT